MFGSGPTEEIRLESKTAQHVPADEKESQARFEKELDDDGADARQPPSVFERFKRWVASLR